MQASRCCSPGPRLTSVFSYVPPLSLLKGKKEQVEERQGGDEIFDEHQKWYQKWLRLTANSTQCSLNKRRFIFLT